MPSSLFMQNVVAEEQGRLERWRAAWNAYFGTFEPALKIKAGQPDDNVSINYVRMIVDTGVAFLFGQEPEFELGLGGDETPAEQWLEEVWRVNRKMQLLQKLAANGAVCGHVFVKLQPPALEPGYPRIINLSPEYMSVVTDPNDIDQVLRYVIQYPARGCNGEQLAIKQTIERTGPGWTITDEESVEGGRWQLVQKIDWPYAWPPIVDCQNLPSPNEYYGIADVEEDVLGLNKAINFALSNLQRIIRFHAHPKTWGTGFNSKDLLVGVDSTLILPSGATLQNLEMQSDLQSSLEYYLRLKEALHETSQTPEVAAGKLESAGALSGVALQILFQPIIRRTNVKRLTYGELLVELNRRLLELGGFGADNLTTLRWPEILPKNKMEELQAAQIKEQLGVSQDSILQEIGYNPDDERAKREASGADMADQLLSAFDRGQ